MTTYTSGSTKDGDGARWSIIRADDTNPSTDTVFSNWYVKGPPGVYGPYDEAQAKRCLNEKIGIPNATPLRPDVQPEEPVGPTPEDCAECGREG